MIEDSDKWYGEKVFDMSKKEYEKFINHIKTIKSKIKSPTELDEISNKLKNGKKLKNLEKDLTNKLDAMDKFLENLKDALKKIHIPDIYSMNKYKEKCGGDFDIKIKDLEIVKTNIKNNKEFQDIFNKIEINIDDITKAYEGMMKLSEESLEYDDGDMKKLDRVYTNSELPNRIKSFDGPDSTLQYMKRRYESFNESGAYKRYKSFIEKNSDKTWKEYKYDKMSKFSMEDHIRIYNDEYMYLGTAIKNYDEVWKNLMKGWEPDGRKKSSSGGYGIWMTPTKKGAAYYATHRLTQKGISNDYEKIINSRYYPSIYKVKIDTNAVFFDEVDTDMDKAEMKLLKLIGLAGTHSGYKEAPGGNTVESCIIDEKYILEMTKLSDKEILDMEECPDKEILTGLIKYKKKHTNQ